MSSVAVDSAPQQAQASFERGLELSGAERWLAAREAFLASVALAPRASTYFNLALVSLELGLGRAALDALSRFEQLADLPQLQEFRPQAISLRERAKALIGTVVLSVDPEDCSVQVDGTAQQGAGRERVLLLDPGDHVIRIDAAGKQARTIDVTVVARGAVHRRVELAASVPAADLAPPAVAVAAQKPSVVPMSAPDAQARDDYSLLEEPLFWAIAVGVVAVGAGVTIFAVALSQDPGTAEPYAGTSNRVLDPSK